MANKNRFQPYTLITDKLQKPLRHMMREAGIKVTKKNRSYAESLAFLYKQKPELLRTMDTVVMAEEWYWMQNGCNVIFPASAKVLNKLLKAKVELKNAEAVRMPHSSFVIAMPRDYTFNGRPLPGILVTCTTHDERDMVVNEYTKAVTGKSLSRRSDHYQSDFVLTINYMMDDRHVKYHSGGEDAAGTYRVCVPSYMIPELMAQEDAESFSRVLGDFDKEYVACMKLQPDEVEMQHHVTKLVLMIGIYANAFPDALQSGYPGVPPKNMAPPMHKRWTNTRLDLASDHADADNELNYHYRSWHFRQLMHKKYYQGEHASKPIGSRVVFVRDAMVGREIEPETLEVK